MKEIRNIKFGGSMTPAEKQILNDIAKRLGISKTEAIIKALKELNEKL